MSDIILLFLERICEAIYFSLFLIYGKKLENKKLLFMFIMIMEYLLLTHIFYYNVIFQVCYTFMSFINLKVLYKEKAQITDIFLFAVASIVLIIISILSSSVVMFTGITWLYYVMLVVNRVLIFAFIFIFKNQIYILYKKFCSNWNRHKDNKIKSLTLRNVSVIIFNIMFYVINIYMLYAILTRE